MASKRAAIEGRSRSSRGEASVWPRVGLSVGALVAVAVPAAANGAYFPTSWGWAALAFAWVSVVALLTRRTLLLSGLEWAILAAFAGLSGWTALSTLWSADVTGTVLEVERGLVYLTALLALFVIFKRTAVPELLGGALAGITLTAAYGLATRLFPERLGYFDDLALNRLARPLGYWNALGIFAVMGCLIALGFAARGRTLWSRVLAAASLPVLVTTLYFTFGRGPWIALGAGLLAALAFDARRLQLVSTFLVVAPGPALAVWLASRSEGLTTNSPAVTLASTQGHTLALIILALMAGGAMAVVALSLVEQRLPNLPRGRLAYGAAVWMIALVGLGAIFSVYGTPATIARNAYHDFKSTGGGGTTGAGTNLNKRLLSFAGNGRVQYWQAAWHDAQDHPWLGAGAGTFEQYWFRHRTIPGKVRDAHGLYVETLAELGPAGLGLLVIALALPLVAAVRARRNALATGAVGAYVAYLVHAGADWDWEMTAVTLTALVCAAALLISARDETHEQPVRLPLRGVAVAAAVLAGAFALVALISNSALSASDRAATAGNLSKAEGQARKAIRWAPWSSEGWSLLGDLQVQERKLADARASYRKAIAKDRSDWTIWLDLAYASSGPARRKAALVALRLNPRSPQIAAARTELGLGKH